MPCTSVCLRMTLILLPLLFLSVLSEANMWTQTDWSGGPRQLSWSDTAMYYTGTHVDGWSSPGDLKLTGPDDSCWVNTGDLTGAWKVNSLLECSDGVLYAATGIYGEVFKSVDDGTTWVNMGSLLGAWEVHTLIETSDGCLYAGTYPHGDVFRSIDAGNTWVNTGDLTGVGTVLSLVEASDGCLYAGTVPGSVFRSVDAGTTWVRTGDLGGTVVYSVIEASDGALYAGTYPNGNVFKSVDAGTTWVNTGNLSEASYVFSLIEASDGALYAGTGFDGDVFRSVDAGTTWVNTGDLASADWVYSLIENSNGVLYAGTGFDGDVFRSVDAGTTWVNTGDLAGAGLVWSLMEASDGALYAGTGDHGDVFKAGYFASGDLVSSVYETENPSVSFGVMIWDQTLNSQAIAIRVRTDTLPDMSTATDWDTCPPVINGQDISDLSSVDDNERYIQYRAEFSTSRSDVTPVLHEVSIEYEVGIEQEVKSRSSISRYQLQQTRPNPVHRTVVIRYLLADVEESVPVFLGLYDLAGRLVETLTDERQDPGIYRVRWDVKNNPSGVYFYHLKAGDFTCTKKMVVID